MKKAILSVISFCLLLHLSAQSTYTVSNTNDAGSGSLRQAIENANTNGDGLDIINFSDEVTGTILLNSQLPVITTALTINGPGEDVLSVSGQNAYRILFINSTGDVTINNLTLKEGRATGGNAGSGASGGGGGAGMGGAIFLEQGNLSLNFTSLVSNSARGGNGGTFNNPSTAFGGAGGAGPLGAGGASTTEDGANGVFGSGGSGGGLRFSGEARANGGNGGYGAGAGSVGSSGGGASGLGTTGVAGTFGGSTSNPANGVVQSGGGGAGLGAALFIYGGSASLNTVTVLNNTTQAGASGGSGASSGQAKASGIFHYSGSLTNNGVFVSGNTASNAGSTASDNADFYSHTGLTLVESNPPVISKSIPANNETNYQKADGLVIYINENVFKTDGGSIVDADLSGIVTFKETNASGSDIAFTASIVRNNITITPDSELANGQTYYIAVSSLEDRYGNEMGAPESITFTVDGTAPVFTANPESGTTILGRSFAFTADEAFFDIDGTEIEPSEYINVVKVRLDDATGELVSTTITRDGNTLQVSLDESLPDQLYHVTLENIADANGNEITPQVFTYSRPAFAEAKIRVNPRNGTTLSTQAIEVTFEEDYYVETAPGTFALFKTRSFSQSYTDAVLDLKLNDENGTDIIDKWSFNTDGDVLYILSNMERNSTYYLKIANLFTADQTPVEAVEITFDTPDQFHPVPGGGYSLTNFRTTISGAALGSQASMEFIIKLNGGSRRQGLFQGWASDFSDRLLFWLNDDQLVLSVLDGSGNVISNQSISSNTFDESALASSFQHVGFTHDNGTVVFYYNGQPVGSGTLEISDYSFSQTGTDYSSLTGDFGSVSLDPSGFMSVDEVRVWSTALSSQVVSDWHQIKMSDTHPNFDQCRNLWLFDESGGKLSWDSKNKEANYSFNTEPIRTVSTRFAVPQVQVSADDIVLASGDEVTFTAGNGGQLQKEFTITNTGTVDLNLLGEASVSDFEGRFEIDYSETDLLLAPGASTSFTVTFQSSDVRVYNTFLTIPNSSLNNVFEVALVGRGVSLSNGNWEPVGGRDALPAISELWANDNDIFFVTSLPNPPYSSLLIRASIDPDGNINYEEETTLPFSYNSGSYYDLVGDNSGNFYSLTDPGNGTGIQVKNIITNQSESFLLETTNDAMDGLLRLDNNGIVRFVHSYSDGGAYNEYGIKVQEGLPSTETITLTMEDLRTIFGTDIGSSLFAYSIDFDSNNQLFATVSTNSNYVLVLKYNPTTGWEDIGYDYNTTYGSGTYYYVNLIIDQNDNIHVGGIDRGRLRYHKFSPSGNLSEGEYSGVEGISSDFTSNASRQGIHLFGLGAANEPMFLFRGPSSSLGVSAALYENGSFRLFNERYITGTDPESTSSPQLAVDRVTGRPFISTDGSNGPSDLWTTQSIAPELTATINGRSIGSGNTLPVQIGVGFEEELDLIITNSGLTNLSLTGDPIVTFTGAQAGDLSFDISGVTSSLTIGEQVSIPITFAPRTVYTNQEVVVSIPNTTPAGNLEITLVLNALDDTNTGEWSVHTDIVDPPYTDADMRIGKNNQPVYTFNTYQTIVYPSGPNAGVAIPYARLETYQEVSGFETFDPDVLDENINLSTTYPLTDYFPQIQALVNPSNNLNHFAYGTIQSNNIRPNLFASHPLTGLSRVTDAYNRIGRADFEFDENGDAWFLLMDDQNSYLFLASNAGGQDIFFTGLTRTSKDLDLEIAPDFMYSMTQEFGQALGYKSPRGIQSTSQGAVTFLGSGSNQLRNGNFSDETHNKDIELYNGKQYTAWIRSDGGIEFLENTTFITRPAASNVIDLQLQIHPDGTPYIAYIENLGNNQFPVSVVKYVDGTWETVGESRFSYGDYDDQHAGLTNAPTRPVLRAAFQINDLGQLFVFYGDIYTVIEAPAAFNRPPAFTSTPVTEVDEDVEYVYNITTSDIDLDALTISTVDLPAWLTFTDNGDGTAVISGTPTDEDAIEYSFSVTVSDGSLLTTQEISLTVNDLNTAPFFDQPVSTLAFDQDAALQSLELTGLSDGDFHLDQTLSFEITNDNAFLLSSITATVNDDGTGSLLYQPASGESGVATITLTLLDDGTPQKSIAYNIEITVSPVTDPNAIVVTNTNDSGEGSLRAAIIETNENPDHNVIDLRFIEGTIALASSLPSLSSNMDIIGTDASPVTVSGENAHQVFFMESGLVTLRSFTVANGRNTGGAGSIGDGGGGGGAGFGGAIFLNDGNLIVDRMTFTGNTAQGGAGANSSGVLGGQGGSSLFGDGGDGGASVFDQPGGNGGNGSFFGTGGGGGGQGSSVFVGGRGGNGNVGGGAGGGGGSSSGQGGNTGSAGQFGGNGGVAQRGGGGGGGAGLGGAIFAKAGNLIISNSTFSSNSASGGAAGTNSGTNQTSEPNGGQGKGGAIFLYQDVAYKLIDVVYSGNNASNSFNAIGDDNNIYIGTSKGAPAIFLSDASIDENQSGIVEIGRLSTFTGNPADVFTYSINSSNLDLSDLEIDGDVLRYVGTGLDFETRSSFNVLIESIAGSGTNLSNFTIAVNDLDDPATDFVLETLTLDEGQSIGFTVGSFSVTDVDGGTHEFILTDGYGDNTSFQIVGDELQVAEVFDFDDRSFYDIQVELQDITKQFTITVNNINVAPTAITLSNSSIPENSFGDVLIGTLSAVDSDDEDTHTFGFTGVAGLETDDFKLINGDLYTNRNFDFETETSLQVEVFARDNNAASVNQTLTITITDANDVPSGITLSGTEVLETAVAGVEIGILSAVDQDATGEYTFSLVQGYEENYAFTIVGASLQTAFAISQTQLPSYDIRVLVTDLAGGANQQDFTITVIDVAQAPTDIILSKSNIDEDAPSGSIIGALSTVDANVNDTHTYEVLTSIVIEGQTVFPVIADGSNLITTGPLDFETFPTFELEVKSTDRDELSFTKSFVITANDVNEAPNAMTLSANTIAENAASGTSIGQLVAEDSDANDPLTYSLVAGEGDEDNAFFQIGGAGNELENATVFDFETQSTYSVRARATDESGLFYEEAFTITVVDGNDQPTAIAISSSEVNEDAPVGTVVGILATTDEDTGDQHTYEVLLVNDQTTPLFAMNGANLITTIPLDFENTLVYTVVIEAKDAGGLTWSETFEIAVNDVNEAPTAINLTNTTIDEDTPVGSIIGELTTVDQDANDTHTYEVLTSILVSGQEVFPVVAQGSSLVLAFPADFETIPQFPVEVKTTDLGGLSYTETFTLTANDVNEAPTSINLSGSSIDENATVGTTIGSLTATDEDGNATHTFTLVDGFGDNGSFAISGATLSNAMVFDFETKNTYAIKVKADDGAGGSFEQEFAILINDLSEAVAQTITFDPFDDKTFGDVAFELVATASSNLIVSFTSSDESILSISGTTATILAAGEVIITASQAGNEDFNAAETNQTLTISKASQTITFAALEDKELGADPFALVATASSGLGVSFEVSGPATLVGNELTLSGAGLVTVTASQTGNGNYLAAISVTQSFNVTDPAKTNQTITFDAIDDKTFGDAAFELVATASSNLSVSFASSDESIVSISGTTATILAAGEVIITATQEGNEDFNAAETNQTLTISRASQTITFAALDDKELGADPFALVATASSGLGVSFEVSGPATLVGNELTLSGAGLVTVTASQTGNGNYLAAISVTQSFNVTDPAKTNQTITFDAIDDKTFGDAAFELVATASSNLSVSFASSDESIVSISGTTATILAAGEVIITASQAGNEDFNAAETNQTLTISKASQTIAFAALEDKELGADPFALVASASSGLDVSFEVSGSATLAGNELTITGAGQVSVIASQAGNANYLEATSVTQSFNVTDPAKTNQTITFNPPSEIYVSDGTITLTATSDSGLDVVFELISGESFASVSGTELTPTAAGIVEIKATQPGNNSFNAANSVTRSILIKPVFKISGAITDENGDPFSDGTAVLFKAGKTTGEATTIAEDGTYTFENVKDGTFFFGVVPNDMKAYYITAYGNTIVYRQSTPLNVTNANLQNIDLQMIPLEDNSSELNGDGVVTGRVIDSDQAGGRIEMGRILEGDPVEGASIFLVRKSDDKILTEVFSDINGDFEITGIPEGSFKILINIPGVAGAVETDVEVQKGKKILMTAMVGPEGIVFEVENVLATNEIIDSWNVFPNPVVDQLFLVLDSKVRSFKWEVFNMQGQQVLSGNANGNNASLHFKELSAAIYLITIKDDRGIQAQFRIKNN